MADTTNLCPHCGERMSRWQPPEGTSWEEEFHFVCFNDTCPYFVRGWEWMETRFGRKASYRHRLDPRSGAAGPLAVWSAEALRERIVDEGGADSA